MATGPDVYRASTQLKLYLLCLPAVAVQNKKSELMLMRRATMLPPQKFEQIVQ